MVDNKRALIFMSIGVVGISFAAAFVRWSGVSAGLSAFYRLFYGTLSLFLMISFMHIRSKKYSIYKSIPSDLIKKSFLAGLFLGVDLYIWHISILMIGSGLATVIANTQVFHTVIIGSFFLGEKLDWKWKLILPIAFIGVGLIAVKDFNIEVDTDFIIGTSYSVVAGFLYAIFLYFTKSIRGKYESIPSIVTWFYITFFCFVTITVLNLFDGYIQFDIGLESHAVLFTLGLITTAISWVLISRAISVLPLIKTSFMLLGQPVLATVWGVLFFEEYLTTLQMIGLVITVSMLFYGQFLKIKS